MKIHLFVKYFNPLFPLKFRACLIEKRIKCTKIQYELTILSIYFSLLTDIYFPFHIEALEIVLQEIQILIYILFDDI